jgi:hypothetical protein
MKAIKITLYTCGSLMIVAAIAGTIDYKAAQKNGSIKNLYNEEKPVVTNTHKEIDVEDYSRGEINRPPEKNTNNAKIKTTKFTPPKIVEDEEIVAVKNKDAIKLELPKSKKLSYKSFSRGPLREDDVKYDEVVTVDTLAKPTSLTTEE